MELNKARQCRKFILFFISDYARWAYGPMSSVAYVHVAMCGYIKVRVFVQPRLCWPHEVARVHHAHKYEVW